MQQQGDRRSWEGGTAGQGSLWQQGDCWFKEEELGIHQSMPMRSLLRPCAGVHPPKGPTRGVGAIEHVIAQHKALGYPARWVVPTRDLIHSVVEILKPLETPKPRNRPHGSSCSQGLTLMLVECLRAARFLPPTCPAQAQPCPGLTPQLPNRMSVCQPHPGVFRCLAEAPYG